MVVLPAWTDQFGNAARVVSRNVGVRGDLMEVTAEKLTAMVERVLTDQTIRASSSEMPISAMRTRSWKDWFGSSGVMPGLKL